MAKPNNSKWQCDLDLQKYIYFHKKRLRKRPVVKDTAKCKCSFASCSPGPRLDMDPDIVAALDEDFDFDDPENMLEDDFVVKANDVMG